MGYDLHITRRDNWFEKDQKEKYITIEEWLNYVHLKSSDLVLSNAYWVKIPGDDTKSQVASGFSEWSAHPQNERPWFDYSHGNISAKNPDESTILKMISMAKDLRAKVQGDDGEIYELSANNEIISIQPGARLEDKIKTKKEKSWWKFW